MQKLFKDENFGFLGRWLDKLFSLSLEQLIILCFVNIFFFFLLFLGISYIPGQGTLLNDLDWQDKIISALHYSTAIASNTGVGDLGNINIFRILAMLEMIIGIFLFTFVIAKLTTRKSAEIMKNLFEMETETNYRNILEELFKIRKRLDAILVRGEQKQQISATLDDEDRILLGLTFVELSSALILTPKLLLNIGDDSKLDRNRQEVLVAMIRRTIIRLYSILHKMNNLKIHWFSDRNIEKLVECIALHRKYHQNIIKHKSHFSKYLLEEIEQSKVYSEYLEGEIENARV